MIHLFFLFFIPFLYLPDVVFALDSDSDQTAVVDAHEIEIDFGTGQRIYRGNVTIQQGTLHMTADEIRLFFNDDILERAIAHGQPAVFRQQPEGSDHFIRGQARKIEIDEIENVAIFSGDAKLQQHRDTITGETIVYHMKTEKMTVRGNIDLLGQTKHLSTSEAAKNATGSKSEHSTRPKIVIQPSDGIFDESTTTSPEPSILSTTNDADQVSTTTQPVDNQTPAEEKLGSPGNSLQFHAARVINAGAATYSMPNANAALLGGLSGGTPVKVLEIRNDWAHVTIPDGVNVWVFSSYVVENGNNAGEIEGRGVRARWLPSTESSVVGIFEPGVRVRILKTRGNWKQVSVPSSFPTWVPVMQLDMLEAISPAWKSEWTAQSGLLFGTEN
jgi:lipopolysaccharide export system protein LptA